MIKGCNIFWGQKLANTCSFCGQAHYCATRQNLENRTQLDEPAECTSAGDPLLLYKILHLLFFPSGANSLCTTSWELKKNYQHGLDAGPLEFQFLWPRGCLTDPFRTLSLCFRVTGKTPSLISRNNFVKKIFVCIGHCDNVLARCYSIFPLLRCQGVWNKHAYNFLFPKSPFRIWRTTVLGIFKVSVIILDVIQWSFLTKSATAAMFTSFWVDFGWPPRSSSSTSSLPSQNRKYNLKTFDRFTASFPKALCTNTSVSVVDRPALKQNFMATLHLYTPSMT